MQQLEEFLSAADSNGGVAKLKEGVQEVVEKGSELVEKGVEKGKEVVQQGKEYVQKTSMSEMATDLKDLIGRHPVYSAVIGVGLGFLVGRMLTSSKGS